MLGFLSIRHRPPFVLEVIERRATSAWFIGIAGATPATPQRPALLTAIAAHYADGGRAKDDPVCAYLGLTHREDLRLRFLLLGTKSTSIGAAPTDCQYGSARI